MKVGKNKFLICHIFRDFIKFKLIVGCNQVPHLGFWSSLGHRLADISDYLCRCQGPPEDDLAASLQNDDEAILPM